MLNQSSTFIQTSTFELRRPISHSYHTNTSRSSPVVKSNGSSSTGSEMNTLKTSPWSLSGSVVVETTQIFSDVSIYDYATELPSESTFVLSVSQLSTAQLVMESSSFDDAIIASSSGYSSASTSSSIDSFTSFEASVSVMNNIETKKSMTIPFTHASAKSTRLTPSAIMTSVQLVVNDGNVSSSTPGLFLSAEFQSQNQTVSVTTTSADSILLPASSLAMATTVASISQNFASPSLMAPHNGTSHSSVSGERTFSSRTMALSQGIPTPSSPSYTSAHDGLVVMSYSTPCYIYFVVEKTVLPVLSANHSLTTLSTPKVALDVGSITSLLPKFPSVTLTRTASMTTHPPGIHNQTHVSFDATGSFSKFAGESLISRVEETTTVTLIRSTGSSMLPPHSRLLSQVRSESTQPETGTSFNDPVTASLSKFLSASTSTFPFVATHSFLEKYDLSTFKASFASTRKSTAGATYMASSIAPTSSFQSREFNPTIASPMSFPSLGSRGRTSSIVSQVMSRSVVQSTKELVLQTRPASLSSNQVLFAVTSSTLSNHSSNSNATRSLESSRSKTSTLSMLPSVTIQTSSRKISSTDFNATSLLNGNVNSTIYRTPSAISNVEAAKSSSTFSFDENRLSGSIQLSSDSNNSTVSQSTKELVLQAGPASSSSNQVLFAVTSSTLSNHSSNSNATRSLESSRSKTSTLSMLPSVTIQIPSRKMSSTDFNTTSLLNGNVNSAIYRTPSAISNVEAAKSSLTFSFDENRLSGSIQLSSDSNNSTVSHASTFLQSSSSSSNQEPTLFNTPELPSASGSFSDLSLSRSMSISASMAASDSGPSSFSISSSSGVFSPEDSTGVSWSAVPESTSSPQETVVEASTGLSGKNSLSSKYPSQGTAVAQSSKSVSTSVIMTTQGLVIGSTIIDKSSTQALLTSETLSASPASLNMSSTDQPSFMMSASSSMLIKNSSFTTLTSSLSSSTSTKQSTVPASSDSVIKNSSSIALMTSMVNQNSKSSVNLTTSVFSNRIFPSSTVSEQKMRSAGVLTYSLSNETVSPPLVSSRDSMSLSTISGLSKVADLTLPISMTTSTSQEAVNSVSFLSISSNLSTYSVVFRNTSERGSSTLVMSSQTPSTHKTPASSVVVTPSVLLQSGTTTLATDLKESSVPVVASLHQTQNVRSSSLVASSTFGSVPSSFPGYSVLTSKFKSTKVQQTLSSLPLMQRSALAIQSSLPQTSSMSLMKSSTSPFVYRPPLMTMSSLGICYVIYTTRLIQPVPSPTPQVTVNFTRIANASFVSTSVIMTTQGLVIGSTIIDKSSTQALLTSETLSASPASLNMSSTDQPSFMMSASSSMLIKNSSSNSLNFTSSDLRPPTLTTSASSMRSVAVNTTTTSSFTTNVFAINSTVVSSEASYMSVISVSSSGSVLLAVSSLEMSRTASVTPAVSSTMKMSTASVSLSASSFENSTASSFTIAASSLEISAAASTFVTTLLSSPQVRTSQVSSTRAFSPAVSSSVSVPLTTSPPESSLLQTTLTVPLETDIRSEKFKRDLEDNFVTAYKLAERTSKRRRRNAGEVTATVSSHVLFLCFSGHWLCSCLDYRLRRMRVKF